MSSNHTSTKFIPKERNVGGAFQFYGSRTPRILILEVDTTGTIVPEPLQSAVDQALERLPLLKSTFVRKKGLYYYADNGLPVIVAESDEARQIGGETTNYHMLDVTFSGSCIRFAAFHGLCDGYALSRFAETTLYYYFCTKDNKDYDDDGIMTHKTPADPSETVDVFDRKIKANTKELKALSDKTPRYRLPELTDGKGPQMYRYPLKIKTEELIAWCKTCGASPGSAVAAMVAQAVAKENNLNSETVMAVLPTSVRKQLHAEKSLKNCNTAIFLPISSEICRYQQVGTIAAQLRKDMKAQLTERFALLTVAGINMILDLGKKMPGYFLKNKIMSIKEKKPQDTFSVDYLGTLRTSGYSDQITDVRILNPDSFRGSMFIMINDAAGFFNISFNQTFDSDRYYLAFLKILGELGIAYEKGRPGAYLNLEVEMPAEQR